MSQYLYQFFDIYHSRFSTGSQTLKIILCEKIQKIILVISPIGFLTRNIFSTFENLSRTQNYVSYIYKCIQTKLKNIHNGIKLVKESNIEILS